MPMKMQSRIGTAPKLPQARSAAPRQELLCDSIVTKYTDGSNHSLSMYAYDLLENQILREGYYWDSEQDDWIGSYKYVSAYDFIGNQTLSEDYEWDSDKNDWVGGYKYVSAYDANGNQTLYEYYEWGSDEWVELYSCKYVYAYDTNGNVTLEESYYWNSDEWVLSTISTYYYTLRDLWHIDTEEAQIDNSLEMCYRVSGGVLTVVPAAEGVVTVYTLSGSAIASAEAGEGQQIEIALPARGVYIVKTAAATAKVVW